MTDYSKLSDAEIAERVCRKLGWFGLDTDDLADWLIATLNLPDDCCQWFGWDFNGVELMRICCFDWPAPIMMQKVEEWLASNGYGWSISEYSPGLFDVFIHRNEWDYCLNFQSQIETRALYEAFLQVGE